MMSADSVILSVAKAGWPGSRFGRRTTPAEMANSSTLNAVRLKGVVQHYDWGIKGGGNNGVVAQMALAGEEPTKPFAEIWFGTHPAAPAELIDATSQEDDPALSKFLTEKGKGSSLTQFFEADPAFLGEKTRGRFGAELPFLLKCLSVAKPLSIQAHPDKGSETA